jgi:hypothetical protein
MACSSSIYKTWRAIPLAELTSEARKTYLMPSFPARHLLHCAKLDKSVCLAENGNSEVHRDTSEPHCSNGGRKIMAAIL